MQKTTETPYLIREYLDSLQWRYATKKFDPERRISDADLAQLLQAIRMSASSYGLQPYKVLVIRDPELRAQLRPACWNQPQITDASHVLVFASRSDFDGELIDSYLEVVSKTRKVPLGDLEGYGAFMKSKLLGLTPPQKANWTARQAYIALGNLMSAAAMHRIDTCPMEGFEAEQVDQLLGLERKGLTTTLIAAVGYRSEADQTQHLAKVRRPETSLFEYL